MKNKLFLFTIFAAILFVIGACGNKDVDDTNESSIDEGDASAETTAYEPEDIKETDVCEVCAMAVPNNEHATQIVLTNDRSIKFDDLGCMHEWIDENGTDEIGTAFVRDYHSQEWFDYKEATFVFDETIDTPMAYGVISFSDEAEATLFVEEFGKGELLTYADLAEHEWKMHRDMMDHDHDEHDHDDDNE